MSGLCSLEYSPWRFWGLLGKWSRRSCAQMGADGQTWWRWEGKKSERSSKTTCRQTDWRAHRCTSSKTASIELLLSEWEKQGKDQMELLSWRRGWCNSHVLCPSARVLCRRCRCEVNIRKNVGKHGTSKILISLLYISNPRKSHLDFICSGSDLLQKKQKKQHKTLKISKVFIL